MKLVMEDATALFETFGVNLTVTPKPFSLMAHQPTTSAVPGTTSSPTLLPPHHWNELFIFNKDGLALPCGLGTVAGRQACRL